jgi:uncharacterized membrane protein YkgB
MPLSRIALFVVFFWFGALKVIGESPASPLVKNLFYKTMPVMSFDTFLIIFGLFECLIGILFLIPRMERVVIPLLFIHMVTTFGPLFLLRNSMWSKMFVPTLEGQYIIKNLVIIATAIGVAAHLHPIKRA